MLFKNILEPCYSLLSSVMLGISDIAYIYPKTLITQLRTKQVMVNDAKSLQEFKQHKNASKFGICSRRNVVLNLNKLCQRTTDLFFNLLNTAQICSSEVSFNWKEPPTHLLNSVVKARRIWEISANTSTVIQISFWHKYDISHFLVIATTIDVTKARSFSYLTAKTVEFCLNFIKDSSFSLIRFKAFVLVKPAVLTEAYFLNTLNK